MFLWIINSPDGRELGRVEANDARVAFLLWRGSIPTFRQDIHAATEADGSSRVTYQGESFVLRKEAPQ